MNDGLHALRPYQLDPARAIIDSVVNQRGLTFTVEMSRQAGKNETSAQLEAALLALAAGGVIDSNAENIKTAPTYSPQVLISLRRLRDALRSARLPAYSEAGHIVRVGNARQVFLSADEHANVAGHTATHLLEVDEAQDIDADTYDRQFRPMAAANNATTVLYGTAWSEVDLLHRERLAALAAQRHDGVRRAFVIPWPIVGEHNPAYAKYVAAERARLGPANPMFTTQYELVPLPSKGRLFTADQHAAMRGEHARRDTPPPVATIVAGLDVAGGDDDNPEAHDRTVLTLAAVTPPGPADPIPDNHIAVLHHIAWHGTPHDQLLPAVIDAVKRWRVRRIDVDATGLGETLAAVLQRATNATVVPLKVTRPSKSALGFQLIAAASTARLKLYEPDGSDDANTLAAELEHARADYLPGGLMNFYVPDAEGHDDYLFSLALCNAAAAAVEVRRARGRSAQ